MYRWEVEQSQRRLEKVVGVPWNRKKRLWEGCCTSSHPSLCIAISIYPLIPTLGCSKHLDIEGGRMDRCYTGKLDCNIPEKNKRTPDALMALQHHCRYLPSNMFSLYNNIVQSEGVNSRVERQQIKKTARQWRKNLLQAVCCMDVGMAGVEQQLGK